MFFSVWKVNNLHIRHHCLFVCECKNDQEGKGKPCQVGTEESYKTWVKNMHRSPSGWKEKTKCSGRRKRRQEATRYNRQRKKQGWSESVFKCAVSVLHRFLQWIPAIVPTFLKPSIKLPQRVSKSSFSVLWTKKYTWKWTSKYSFKNSFQNFYIYRTHIYHKCTDNFLKRVCCFEWNHPDMCL